MLINCDFKSLEVFVAADLSDDRILKTELCNKIDSHSVNQERFKLPDRVVAKRFLFKLLYGATAFGYSTDSDFITVGYSERQWQRVIDEFYNKYTGIREWHRRIMQLVRATGYLSIPSGRIYHYTPTVTTRGLKWPDTKIKNYPVNYSGF